MYKNNNVEFHDLNYVNNNVVELPEKLCPVIRQNNFKLFSNSETELKHEIVYDAFHHFNIPYDKWYVLLCGKMTYKPAIIDKYHTGFHCTFDCNFWKKNDVVKTFGYINVSTWVKIPHNLRETGFDQNDMNDVVKCISSSRKLMWHPTLLGNKPALNFVISSLKLMTVF